MTEATIIDGEVATSTDLLALDIEAIKQDMLAMDAAIKQADKDVELYSVSDDVLAGMDDKQVDACTKALNADVNAYETARKSLKARLAAPYDSIKAEGDRRMESIKAIQATYKTARDANEARRKDEKYHDLETYYCEYAELLVPVVSYSKLHDPKWLNKTVKLDTAKAELEAKVNRVNTDWQSLQRMDLEFYDTVEATFFSTLDLGEAIACNDKLVADRKRIEALKAEIAQPKEDPVKELDPVVELIKAPEPIVVKDEVVPCVMIIDGATIQQQRDIGKFCGSIGVHGRFVRGTLAQAYQSTKQVLQYGA